MNTLVEADFKPVKLGDTIHGWRYEDERYIVALVLCWDGCDVKVTFKSNPIHTGCLSDHIKRSEPSFDDADVKQALAIANIIIQEAELAPH